MRPRSPFIRISHLKLNFLLYPAFPSASDPGHLAPFPPFRFPVIFRYQRCWYVNVLTARLPTFPSRSSPGLIFSFQEISSPIRPVRVVSKHAFRPYLKHRCYTLFVTPLKVASPWGNNAR